ncbi:phage protein [Staphylococcus epidermidis 528m]|nr:phage protein [Staphylococcus epidermidis 528m]
MDKLLGRRIQLENEVDQLQEKHEKLLKEAKEFKFKAEVLDKIN